MSGFSLRTLGFPEILGDDRPIKLNLRKGLGLLIYLAEARGAVARDVMATLLWPESPPETARARLRRMLHRIELALGHHVFEADRTSVRWSPAVELKVDSHLFENACARDAFEDACRRYRGDYLAGFSLPDCPEFDDWAFFRREALRGRGPACIKFAVDHPRLVAGLILFGSLAKGSRTPDYPHALRPSQYDAWLRRLVDEWGGPAGLEILAPSLARDAQARAWWAGVLRAASSPGAVEAMLAALRDTDVRDLLPRVSVPTLVLHRRDDRAVLIAAGRDMASKIPGAQFVELDGDDHWFFAGAQQPVFEAIKRFVGALPRERRAR